MKEIERVNTGRQKELDVAKGLAIVFMILVHVAEYYSNYENIAVMNWIEFLGSPPAAPVFMMLLGVGVVYTCHNRAEDLRKRGISLLLLGYAFNTVVYALPYLLSYWFYGDEENYIYALGEFLDVDILQFAGMSFLFFALAKWRNWSNLKMVGMVVLCQIGRFFLSGQLVLEEGVAASLIGLLVGLNEDSYFPFASWIAFPVVGYLFGQVLIQCKDKKKLYTKIVAAGGILYTVLYFLGGFLQIDYGARGELYQDSYYHMGLYGNVTLCVFALFWIGICFFLSLYIPEWIQKHISRWSRNITYIYCCQYFLIIYLQVFLIGEENTFDLPYVFLLTLGIGIASDVLAAITVKQLKKKV